MGLQKAHTFNILGRQEICPESYWIITEVNGRGNEGKLVFSGYKNQQDSVDNRANPLEDKVYRVSIAELDALTTGNALQNIGGFVIGTKDVATVDNNGDTIWISFFEDAVVIQ